VLGSLKNRGSWTNLSKVLLVPGQAMYVGLKQYEIQLIPIHSRLARYSQRRRQGSVGASLGQLDLRGRLEMDCRQRFQHRSTTGKSLLLKHIV
jgi:hypothetical protein